MLTSFNYFESPLWHSGVTQKWNILHKDILPMNLPLRYFLPTSCPHNLSLCPSLLLSFLPTNQTTFICSPNLQLYFIPSPRQSLPSSSLPLSDLILFSPLLLLLTLSPLSSLPPIFYLFLVRLSLLYLTETKAWQYYCDCLITPQMATETSE